MKFKFFKSSLLFTACALSVLPCSNMNAVHQMILVHESEERALLESWINKECLQFEQLFNNFKEQLKGLSPHSNEKLSSICKKIKITRDEIVNKFIEPTRAEVQRLKGTHLEQSNYFKLLNTLLQISSILLSHFDTLYTTLNASLQGKPTALSVAKNLKPIIDSLTADANFKAIDALLAQAHSYALTYDIMLEIKPHYRRIIDVDFNNDDPIEIDISEDAKHTSHIKLAHAFAVIREGLEELRKECRKPAAISNAEMLRIIRSRL